jgi:hypothetical protein
MWRAIASVSDGVILVAFVAAALAALLYRKAIVQERLVRSFASKDRQKAMAVLRAYVPVDAGGLAPEQQFLMAREQIRRRSDRRRQGAIILVTIALVSSAVSLAADYFG